MTGARRRPKYRIDSDHRYATDLAIRGQMIAKGYVPEDYGPDCVAMCASWVFVRSVARTTRTSTRTDMTHGVSPDGKSSAILWR
jgi:hypothetical protein